MINLVLQYLDFPFENIHGIDEVLNSNSPVKLTAPYYSYAKPFGRDVI